MDLAHYPQRHKSSPCPFRPVIGRCIYTISPNQWISSPVCCRFWALLCTMFAGPEEEIILGQAGQAVLQTHMNTHTHSLTHTHIHRSKRTSSYCPACWCRKSLWLISPVAHTELNVVCFGGFFAAFEGVCVSACVFLTALSCLSMVIIKDIFWLYSEIPYTVSRLNKWRVTAPEFPCQDIQVRYYLPATKRTNSTGALLALPLCPGQCVRDDEAHPCQ